MFSPNYQNLYKTKRDVVQFKKNVGFTWEKKTISESNILNAGHGLYTYKKLFKHD